VIQIIAIIVAVAGCIADGVTNETVSSLVTCMSSEGTVSGNQEYALSVQIDCFGATADCGCIPAGGGSCYLFWGGMIEHDNCDKLLGEYQAAMEGTVALDIISTVAIFSLSILTCVSACRCGNAVDDAAIGKVSEGGIVMQNVPGNNGLGPQVYVALVADDVAVGGKHV
jgi:hypothetical protein